MFKRRQDCRKTVFKMITLILILLENSPRLSQTRHGDVGLETTDVSFSI